METSKFMHNYPSDELMDTLYVYSVEKKGCQPIASISTDSEGAVYVTSHDNKRAKEVKFIIFGLKTVNAKSIIEKCRKAGYEVTKTLRAPIESREATPAQEREARFIHESNLIESVTEQFYDEILANIVAESETGHAGAWKLARLRSHYRTPLTPEMVLEMHSMLTDEQRELGHELKEKYRGKVRDVPVSIAGAVKPVPTQEEFNALIENINREVQKVSGDDLNEILRMVARQHFKFEYLHPFADGNGRIGRILVNYVLAYFQHPPLVITNHDKNKYYLSFSEHAGKPEDMEQFFIEKYRENQVTY